MMTQEEAAKYLVVAWVKGWPLRMYLNTVGGGFKSIEFDKAHEMYKWMPLDVGWFVRNQTVRRYVADAFRSLNDKLWDAKDNTERLALSVIIEKLNGESAKQTECDASRAAFKARRAMVFAKSIGSLHSKLYEGAKRSNWAACK